MSNKAQLESFTAYCNEHPDERFWQALRNWSEYGFIYGSNHPLRDLIGGEESHFLEDTFYKK